MSDPFSKPYNPFGRQSAKKGTETENQETGSGSSKFRERLDEFERVLREAVQDADRSVRDGIKSALPPDAHKHLSNTKREFLLFVRSIVDAEIRRSDERPDAKSAEDKKEKKSE